jgi:hypothetical protein
MEHEPQIVKDHAVVADGGFNDLQSWARGQRWFLPCQNTSFLDGKFMVRSGVVWTDSERVRTDDEEWSWLR